MLTFTLSFSLTSQAAYPPQLAQADANAAPTPTPQAADRLGVLSVRTLDITVGALSTAAHLSPDGTRFAYVSRDDLCIYTSLGVRERCASLQPHEELRRIDSDSIFWSPDGAWLTFTSLWAQFLTDPDIWVMNTGTGRLTNLTDDGIRDIGTGADNFSGNIDISPRWLPDGRLLFIRFTVTDAVMSAPNLMAIAPTGGEPERVGILPHGNVRYGVTQLAPSADGERLAYGVEISDPDNVGLWVSDLSGGAAQRAWEVVIGENMTPMHFSIQRAAFSPDGRYVLSIGYPLDLAARPDPANSFVHLTPLDMLPTTRQFVDPQRYVTGAGWAPNGAALAYVTRTGTADATDATPGLYLTTMPGEPGRLVLEGDFFVPTPLQAVPLIWGENNTLLLGQRESGAIRLIVVTLG